MITRQEYQKRVIDALAGLNFESSRHLALTMAVGYEWLAGEDFSETCAYSNPDKFLVEWNSSLDEIAPRNWDNTEFSKLMVG